MAGHNLQDSIAIDLLSKKWMLKIIVTLNQNKAIRFNTLRNALEGISNNMLSQCLRELEKYQLVERKQYESIPPRVEYSLSELGRSVTPVIKAIAAWSHKVEEANGLLEPTLSDEAIQKQDMIVEMIRAQMDISLICKVSKLSMQDIQLIAKLNNLSI